MSLRHYILVFAVAFTGSFFLAGCLNDDNKIPPNCYDGILNNEEQLVDCGGPCEACFHCIDGIWQPQLGETCVDCGGECGACTQCRNCIQDGDESGIDCGGTFCGPCAVLCDDGILNGNEEQIDCGPNCEPCPTCDDLLMNGNEVGIDCGGTLCAPCITDGSCINSVLDGDEFWINCGGSTCPNCDTILSFKVNNLTHVVLANNVTFSFDGAALNVAGTSLQGGTIQISTNVPPAGWVTGATVTMNQTTIPNKQIGYTDEFGVSYGSGTTETTNGSLNFVRFITTPLPGLIRGTFNGNLSDFAGTSSVSITSGLFMVPVN